MVDWRDRRVLIIGAARQGMALARFLVKHGARVVISDLRDRAELRVEVEALQDIPKIRHPVEWAFGGHPLSLLEGVELVSLSGGVPASIPLAIAARKRGIRLTNDSQIFLEQAPCTVIGITGSSGKTTTTALVGEIAEAWLAELKKPDTEHQIPQVWVGGNIGTPLIASLDEIGPSDLAVMELSSFQLELMDISPQIAAVLNVTPNHMDRHRTMQEYSAIKARILDFQSPKDVAILGREDPVAWNMAQNVHGRCISFGFGEPESHQEGTFMVADDIYLRLAGTAGDQKLMERTDIRLRGEHNLLNVLAACAIAAGAGISGTAMRIGVRNFEGVPHRLEFVRKWQGADWYNDSIATAPERAMAAIRSFDQPLILLSGGRDKDLPWDDFASLVVERVKHAILFGEAAEKILRAIEAARVRVELGSPAGNESTAIASLRTVTHCADLGEAVARANKLVETGDIVLLAPGGTSFDEFNDFEERGECFVRLVKNLA